MRLDHHQSIMGRIIIKNKSKGKKPEPTTTTEKHKEGGKIYKFSPQVVGQKNGYATFASIKEKIIQRAQVELPQGYNVKRSLKEGKEIDFDLMKPKLEIINIKEIMAESDGIGKENYATYTPDRQPTEKEKWRLAVIQERHNKSYNNALERLEDQRETYDENMKKIFIKIFDEYCTSTMQNWLQQHPNFNSVLKDDPIKTLETIKILVQNPVRVVYPMEALTNALKNFLLA